MAECKMKIATAPCLFLCDRRACKICHPGCSLTADITHAENFKKIGETFIEKSSKKGGD